MNKEKLWDLLAAAPLMLWCALGAAGFIILISRQWPPNGIQASLIIMSECSSALFLVQQGVILCIRRLPLVKLKGTGPKLWAIAGANLSLLLLALPRHVPSPPIAALSAGLILLGTVGSVAALATLGRCFSVLPQARGFASHGPYRIVRHPLYLAEQVSCVGLSLQYIQPWGILIALVGFAAQFPRMKYEEMTMASAFPAYAEYARRTPKIIPFILR